MDDLDRKILALLAKNARLTGSMWTLSSASRWPRPSGTSWWS